MTPVEFAALLGPVPEDERFIVCGFRGDPNDATSRSWRPRPWRPGARWPLAPVAHTNGYLGLSTFRQSEDGSWRRRGAEWASGRALMIDDVGTKVPRERVAALPPTVRLETSPGNEQWIYVFREPFHEKAYLDGLITALVDQHLATRDPGMKSVTRVMRVPGHINGKAKHGGWIVRVLKLAAERRFHPESIAQAFGLHVRRRFDRERQASEKNVAAAELWSEVMKIAAERGAILTRPNRAGWMEVICPWEYEHGDRRRRSGAAVNTPSPDNAWAGAFQCHHGCCQERRWKDYAAAVVPSEHTPDIERWLAESSAEKERQK